jgi:NTP pyrophosphatase (non-canonical NTP hydrolase)
MTTIDRPSRALMWAEEMFGPVALQPRERAMRFLEEAQELAHALGLDEVTAAAIAERVYGRPAGAVAREVGQAVMTLELLAKAIGIDAEHEATKEFQRVQSVPKEEWQRRHSAKQKIGIAG